MKMKEDNDKNRKYNDRAQNYNNEWANLRDTDTGSALHEYIRSQDWVYRVDVLAKARNSKQRASNGSGADPDGTKFVKSFFYTRVSIDMKDIAHEAFHHLQLIEKDKRGPQSFGASVSGDIDIAVERFANERHEMTGDFFKEKLGYSVFDPRDYKSGRDFIKKERVSSFDPPSEAQARRIENRVQMEYNLKNGFPAKQGVVEEYNGWPLKNPLGVDR